MDSAPQGMLLVDWLIVVGYMIFTLLLGFYLTRWASGSMEDYFVSGRSLPWWLAGTSMAATTLSVDTPLYISGLVANRGIAANWEWWCFIIGHAVLIYVFARLWRRSEIVTDAELIEMRYSGRSAAALRGIKAFLFAVPINCITMGYIMLAVVKVLGALNIWQEFGFTGGERVLGLDPKLLTVVFVTVLVLLYSGLSGLWGVVVTDFFQFFLALFGAILVAWFAITSQEVGGLDGLVAKAQRFTAFDVLDFVPLTFGADNALGIGMSTFAGLSATSFISYIGVQWWAFRRADGGGEFIQRLAGARDEEEAEKSTWFFNVMHYVVRTWPWILVALAAVVVLQDNAQYQNDPELGYPILMLRYLPAGILGLVVASLVAAFMSTVSTSINWGASYLTNDLYHRFINPEASQSELVYAGRVASVLIAASGAATAFFANNVGGLFRLVIAVGTGPGLVLILRWFWWRINAWAELVSIIVGMVLGFVLSFESYAGTPNLFYIADFGLRVMTITLVTTVLWVAAMYLTRPTDRATRLRFYRKVRPPGPGWKEERAETGLVPSQSLAFEMQRVAAALMILLGLLFGVGGLLLLRWGVALAMGVVAGAGGLWLNHLGFSIAEGKQPAADEEQRPPHRPERTEAA